MESIKAFTLRRDLVAEYDEEYLEMKISDLRNKLDALSRSNFGPQSEIKEIQNSLNPIKAGDIRTKRSIYQLAYRRYILICPDDELLSIILELKSQLYHLDKNGEEIWSPRKLEALEHAIRAHDGSGHLRIEIETLAKAIDEGRFRVRRDEDLRRDVLVFAFSSNLILFLVLLCVLGLFVILKVDIYSQWRKVPVLLFGACGGMLSATMQYRRQRISPGELRIEPVQLFFRSVLGAFAAGIVTLFLQLRIVDFPALHPGMEDGAFLTPGAQYIVAFASGFAERIFFRSTERIFPKLSEAPPMVVQHTTGRPAAKSTSASVSGARSRDTSAIPVRTQSTRRESR
jgi:hypothetical protein